MYATKLAAVKKPVANTIANAVRCSRGDVVARMISLSKEWLK
jgi:hypothetical protein